MPEDREPFLKQLEKSTPEQVRLHLANRIWSEEKTRQAEAWLKNQESLEASEDKAAILTEARATNLLAREANASALEANDIARAASDSAKRSADAARNSNVIASAALAAALMAIVISIIGLQHNGGTSGPQTKAQTAQTH